ncbi:MAG: hypothetical protein R3C53_22185 [Pirellulaceae bacterium]
MVPERAALTSSPWLPAGGLTGERGWTVAKSQRELNPPPSVLAEYQIDFRLPLLDLSQLSDVEISGEPILRSTLDC